MVSAVKSEVPAPTPVAARGKASSESLGTRLAAQASARPSARPSAPPGQQHPLCGEEIVPHHSQSCDLSLLGDSPSRMLSRKEPKKGHSPPWAEGD